MTSQKDFKTLTNPSLDNIEIPELDAQTADQLLGNVLAACNQEPHTIPVEVLESWGNYNRPKFQIGRRITYIILVILVLLPLMFFKPTIVATRTNVNSSVNAIYDIDIKTLLPVRAVSATLDGKPVNVIRTDEKEYSLELTENGLLEIKAVSVNGQVQHRYYTVAHIDTDKPEYVSSYVEKKHIYLTVSDPYSGVDYENISGLIPESYNEESSLLVFEIPKDPVTLTIPDKAGNELTLLISPVEKK